MTSKKNWTLRAAVLMFALVLITSCFVGGTFAKYVTSDSGSAVARVAKFGVAVSVGSDTMFNTKYAIKDPATDVESNAIAYSVASANNTDKLVAPGTSETGTLTFSVTGAPEVAVNVKLALAAYEGKDAIEDVYLAAATGYRDYTTADETKTFDLADKYTPVVFTLKKGDAEVAKGTLADINAKLGELSGNYAPNTNLSTVLGDYTLSWAWAFEGNNQADTLLGNLAAGTVANAAEIDYSTDISFTLNATVTQID